MKKYNLQYTLVGFSKKLGIKIEIIKKLDFRHKIKTSYEDECGFFGRIIVKIVGGDVTETVPP